MTGFRYRAFISYSHADERWAKWLHRSLEAYRIPGKLAGKSSDRGTIPKRLQPVFRDRDELGSAADLSSTVKRALAESDALIVICSPRAAASRWVNEEIREFRSLGRGHRIFAVIVDGDPSDQAGKSCFPAALTESETGATPEPLAADARKWADGRRLAKLKLLAGVLGIPLDRLRRRDLQRRHRQWMLITVSALVLVSIVALAVTSRIAAEKRRVFAEELVGFKLSDLGGRLDLPAEFDILARLDQWTAAEQARAAGLPRDDAMALAADLRASGLSRRRSGDADGAIADFRQSWLMLAMQYSNRTEDRELLFELGQAEFWVGQVLAEQREFDQAERSMGVYADISRRLLRAAPENPEAVLEMAYALTNLGFLNLLRGGTRPDKGLQYMQLALEFNQIALLLDPGNARYRAELEQSHANIADAQLQVCDLGGSLHSRMESTRLAREFHTADPGDERKKRLLAFALGGLASVQQYIGLSDQSRDSLEESIVLLDELHEDYPDNDRYRALRLTRRSRMLELLIHQGQLELARENLDRLQDEWNRYRASDPGRDTRTRVSYAEFLLTRERIETAAGEAESGKAALDEAISELMQVLAEAPDIAVAQAFLAMAAYRHWLINGTAPVAAVMAELPSLEGFDPHRRSCLDVNVAAHLAVMRGDLPAAESYTSHLLSKGYFEPGFIRFCRTRGVCGP